MKVQRYTDTHLTTLIMTQYVQHSEAHMAEAKITIVIRNPFSTGNINGKDLIHQDLQASRQYLYFSIPQQSRSIDQLVKQ